MKASCVFVRDPFHPQKRETRVVGRRRRICSLAPRTAAPHVAILNGRPVLRAEWRRRLKDGDCLAFVVLPQGGDGGSNPMKIVLSIALTVIAPEIGLSIASGVMGGTVAATTFLAGTTITGAMIATAVVGIAGSMLLSAMFPPPRPPTPTQAASIASPSPTYNLQAQGNMARLDSAIPVQYGRMAAFPDFAAQPYAEYAGNEQYLFQLLCLGQGEFDIESIRIEDTAVSSWDEIDYEVVGPGESITMFPTNVVTSVEVSGQEAVGKVTGATYSQSGTTTITVTKTAHGYVAGNKFWLDFTSGTATDGYYTVVTATTDTFTVTASASATTSGNVDLYPVLGPFTANGSATVANTIGIDIILPRGLFYATDSGGLSEVSVTFIVEARLIDDAGAPAGSWTTLGSETITAATTTPQRRSYRYGVPGGRYEVALRRTDVKQTDTRYGHELSWGGLRAYLPETRDFGQVTLIAMRLRASNNLSLQASRKLNVVCTRKLPTWDPVAGWSSTATATRSIAWAFADACRNTVYGGRLDDARIDLQALYDLDAQWTARDDHFDARFDNVLTLWEALQKIAQAGRAKPYLQAGIVCIARDSAQTLPVALYSMRNIVRGSFRVDYLMPSDEMADSVEVAYFDADVWKPRRVTATLGTSTRPAKIEAFGVTDRDHAYREGLYYAAANIYRRKIISFETELEGFIPAFGDLIAVQHDMPAWGQGGEVVAVDGPVLTLTEPLVWVSGQTHYIGLRKRDGSVDGPIRCVKGSTDFEVRLLANPEETPYTGQQGERTHVAFGWGETWRQPARVLRVSPKGPSRVAIECVNEDESVHTADEGVTAPAVATSQLVTLYTAPVVLGLTARSSSDDVAKMLLSWQAAQGAEYYLIEQSNDGDNWTRCGETSASNYAVTALYGSATLVRVAAVGLTRGPWVQINFQAYSDYMWNAVDTTLMWAVDSATPMWTF